MLERRSHPRHGYRRAATIAGFLSLSLWMAAVWAAAGESDGDASRRFAEHMREGAARMRHGEHARALARFKAALKIQPENAEVYYWMGLVYSDMGNYGLAASQADKAALLDKKHAGAWLLWGQSLLRQDPARNAEEAREKLEQAFRLAPLNHLAPFNLGLCYYYGFRDEAQPKRHYHRAKEHFKKALELQPDFLPARFYEGCCYLAVDLPEGAIQAFRDVLSRQPDHVEAWFRRGLAYRRIGRFMEAEKCFLEAVRRDPRHYEGHLQLGYLYASERPDMALCRLHLQRFLDHAPADEPDGPGHPWKKRVREYLAALRAKTSDDRAPDPAPPTPVTDGGAWTD